VESPSTIIRQINYFVNGGILLNMGFKCALKTERTICMKKFKKIIAMCMATVMAMSVMCVGASAAGTENVTAVLEGQNGRWEYVERDANAVMPLATDNDFATFSIPIGPSAYRDLCPTKLVHSGRENAIGIEFQSFTPGNAAPYFNIMNVTDGTWVESEWMGGIHMSTSGFVYYTFSDSYINAHRGDKFAVKMYTLYYPATTTLRTFTTTR